MKFQIDNIITVDNDDYYVADKLLKDGKEYAFLIKTNNDEELLEEFDIVEINEDNTLSEVVNEDLYNSLQEEFVGKMKSENL